MKDSGNEPHFIPKRQEIEERGKTERLKMKLKFLSDIVFYLPFAVVIAYEFIRYIITH